MNEKRRAGDKGWSSRIKGEFHNSPISTIMNTIQIILFIFTISYGLVRFGHFQADWENMKTAVENVCKKVDRLTNANAADHSVLSNSISAQTGKPLELPSERNKGR